MEKNSERFFEWYTKEASAQERIFVDSVMSLGNEYFGDMRFEAGSITSDFIACQSSIGGGKTWLADEVSLPDALQYFSYDWFSYRIEKMEAKCAYFDWLKQEIVISPEYANDDATILHELIHLHEFVIHDGPWFFHDALLWCLYRDLRGKVENLDTKIEEHGHILNETELQSQGGTHDILFLLKSFDLDLRKGYPLGTVFGYGRTEYFAD